MVTERSNFMKEIKNVVILITVDSKDPQCFETSAVPFLPELKNRRNQYDLL